MVPALDMSVPRFTLIALLSFNLGGCFSSTDIETECEVNPCRGNVVASCAGYSDCEALDWCGTTVFCASPDVESPPPEMPCFDGRPDCIELSACDGSESCMEVEWCGETLYCTWEEFECCPENGCFVGPIFCEGETSDVPCAPGEEDCSDSTICGDTMACRPTPSECFDPIYEPCVDATSEVIEAFPGECSEGSGPPANCYETTYCEGMHACVTACPQGAEQLAGPAECEDPDDCYSVDFGRDDLSAFWCQGNGPPCRAVPSCGRNGAEIPFHAECPADKYCRYVDECSTTTHCAYFENVAG